MKQLHYTGKSYWEDGSLITEIRADYGYLLLYGTNTRQFEHLRMSTKSYVEQKHYLDKITSVRDWGRASNKDVQLMDAKKMKEWTKKHGYDTIES